MSVLDRKTYKQVEWYLYNYKKVQKYVQEEKEDIIDGGGRDFGEYGGGQSFRSDPTASRAMRLCKGKITNYEKWLKVLDNVIKRYKDDPLGGIIQKKYVEGLGEVQTCQELHIERTTFYRWREEIILYTAMLAIQEGLLKINKIA